IDFLRQGFWKAGGFKNIYSGLGPAAVGSAPNAAIFFCTYDSVKKLAKQKGISESSGVHMFAASCGEITACVVRVPVEIIKQRRQASSATSSLGTYYIYTCTFLQFALTMYTCTGYCSVYSQQLFVLNLKNTSKNCIEFCWESSEYLVFQICILSFIILNLFGGFHKTFNFNFREIPFSLIQFPLWEFLKKSVESKTGREPSPLESSLCGAASGGFAAALTTPLDVAKTRIMLAPAGSKEASLGIVSTLQLVKQQKGVNGLFAGLVPRVSWISIGGAVFFGVYETVKQILS
ncbi:S-adenosylmethionine mitochondrial carrier protein, partial [Eurytemora carolleeae]|uniref:S-adenosylmethionine mitochondrial carrier protein n=1 Tax=Eurytemora carolleeae TaxID=1294199 RepID=UPI000C782541